MDRIIHWDTKSHTQLSDSLSLFQCDQMNIITSRNYNFIIFFSFMVGPNYPLAYKLSMFYSSRLIYRIYQHLMINNDSYFSARLLLLCFVYLTLKKNLNQWKLTCCSITQSCPTLCDPMDCSMPGSPVLHYLLEFAQTHVHGVSDAIQPSHPLPSPSPSAFNLSQHQGLFKWVRSLHQVAKVLEFQLQHQSFQWIFRIDFH